MLMGPPPDRFDHNPAGDKGGDERGKAALLKLGYASKQTKREHQSQWHPLTGSNRFEIADFSIQEASG
jgi:hypothetical protein